LLDALAAQRDAPTFEVIVVDDGSEDDTAAVLARRSAAAPFPLRTITLAQPMGPAAARNAGWQATSAPFVAFTDDDCVPQPAWLASLFEGLRTADIVQGQTVGNPQQRPTGLFWWAPGATSENGFYETCNVAYRRSTLEQVHGFDAGFRVRPRRAAGVTSAPVWGEDTDLALRAKEHGARSAFAPAAVVWHDLKAGDLRSRVADIPRREGTVLVVKRHPELRQRFRSRWFLDPAHGQLLVAAAGAAALVARPRRRWRWALALLLAAPWVRTRVRGHPVRRWPKLVAQWLVVDSLEVSTLARASVRHRTFFL
jgi:glycosyltransferase involved in cell wall biosynthesis